MKNRSLLNVSINAGGKKKADIRTCCFSESLAARSSRRAYNCCCLRPRAFPLRPWETHFRCFMCNLQKFCMWTQMLQTGEGVFFICFCFSIPLYSGLCSTVDTSFVAMQPIDGVSDVLTVLPSKSCRTGVTRWRGPGLRSNLLCLFWNSLNHVLTVPWSQMFAHASSNMYE